MSIAAIRPFWTDEFFTLYLARIKTISGLTAALATGGDQHPLPYFLLERLSISALGENGIALRLPSIAGFLVMCLCLYAFVARRYGRSYGLAAFSIPPLTRAFHFAIEARGYAPLLGCAGAALLFWELAGTARRRRLAVVGLGLALTLATCCHYYGVFLAIPFGAAQLLRSWRLRRLELGRWCAIGCLWLAPLLSLPLLRNASAPAAHFWAVPEWVDAARFFAVLLAPAAPAFLAVAAALACLPRSQPRSPYRGGPRAESFPVDLDTVVLALSFAALPLFVMVAAKWVTHAFVFRYVLPALLAPAIAIPFVLSRAFGSRAAPAVVFAALFAVGFAVSGYVQIRKYESDRKSVAAMAQSLESTATRRLPIVFGSREASLVASYYAPPELKRRLVYLADSRRSLEYLGFDTVDLCAELLRPWFPVNTAAYAPFIDSHREFYVYTTIDAKWIWILRALLDDGIELTATRQNGSGMLLLANRATRHRSGSASLPGPRFNQR